MAQSINDFISNSMYRITKEIIWQDIQALTQYTKTLKQLDMHKI